MRRLIISDVHIGSKYYRAQELTEFLKHEKYDQLILAGDILDLVKIPTFTKNAADLINAIDFDKEIIYIIGNHDSSLGGFVGEKIFGINFMDFYEFEEGGRKFRIEHGHRYDSGRFHQGFLIKLISVFHALLEERFNIDLTTWYTNYVEKKRKVQHMWDILSHTEGADVVITGHRHTPSAAIWVDENQVITSIINAGDWVTHSTFVIVEDGIARLRKYEGPHSCNQPVPKFVS